MKNLAVFLRIHGQVQGVCYRASAQLKAKNLGLMGWIKNSINGTVESHVEGSKEKIETYIDWCYHGPPAASVSKVELNWILPEGHENFSIK